MGSVEHGAGNVLSHRSDGGFQGAVGKQRNTEWYIETNFWPRLMTFLHATYLF